MPAEIPDFRCWQVERENIGDFNDLNMWTGVCMPSAYIRLVATNAGVQNQYYMFEPPGCYVKFTARTDGQGFDYRSQYQNPVQPIATRLYLRYVPDHALWPSTKGGELQLQLVFDAFSPNDGIDYLTLSVAGQSAGDTLLVNSCNSTRTPTVACGMDKPIRVDYWPSYCGFPKEGLQVPSEIPPQDPTWPPF